MISPLKRKGCGPQGLGSATKMLASPLAFKGANASNSKCWKGCRKVGEKESPTRPGVMVNDCKCD
jgi:hypothetical protein|tara:strand:- start:1544 stop:1738 length:195 start_codon:yes stop_codon:yes gene_type:complete